MREAVRAGRFIEAQQRMRVALRRAFAGDLHYRLDGGPRHGAEALVLINPIVSRAMDEEESALEVAALEIRGAGELFRLALNGLVGDWRRDPGVTAQACKRGEASARLAIPCILDGEIQRMSRRVVFEFTPRAFRALAPPDLALASL